MQINQPTTTATAPTTAAHPVTLAATTAQDEITAINAAHWAEDYNAAVLPRDSHLRQRLARRIPSHLSGRICMGEYGPCGKFGIKLDEADNS